MTAVEDIMKSSDACFWYIEITMQKTAIRADYQVCCIGDFSAINDVAIYYATP